MPTLHRINQWHEDERPREKLIKRGPDALSDAELLAILINTGTKDKTALDIAREIISSREFNLLELGKMTLSDLRTVHGMGEKKAVTLMSALEIGKRRQMALAVERAQINSSRQAFDILVPLFMDKTEEQFVVMYLNHANFLMAVERISTGGMTSTIADIRIIFKRALCGQSTSKIILAHNHPSGHLKPSEADKKLTERIRDGGKLLDIQLVDHLILADNRYYSFADEQILI
ncbi:MAG: DNA repair protein RadC [Chitinophagaceae bacterium]|nr:DNA repair protein RadC [Chitinophagaceae bacterium]